MRIRPPVVTALALAVIALAGAGCGGDDGGNTAAAQCESVDAPAPRPSGGATRPGKPLDATRTFTLVVTTSCGDFEITLDQRVAPQTTASLVALARAGFFDETTFHRVIPGFVAQGGDPTGTGTGGPGYTTTDVPPGDAAYTRGTVAMAKSEFEPPGTAGSQFFVVTADTAPLPPDYAIVGRVTKGFDAVRRIEALGDAATELPVRPVVVDRIAVRES